jgi:hypothetical protein
MHWRGEWAGRILAALALVVLTTAASGCGLFSQGQGDPAAPIVIQGRVVDRAGQGVAGASIQLTVHDYASVEVGQVVPVVYSGSFSAGSDGTFALRLLPTPGLVALAEANGGFVNFDLIAQARPWAFPRELNAGTWAGDIPTIVISRDGVAEPGGDPGVTVPPPEGS